jgi:hypothetical protein
MKHLDKQKHLHSHLPFVLHCFLPPTVNIIHVYQCISYCILKLIPEPDEELRLKCYDSKREYKTKFNNQMAAS